MFLKKTWYFHIRAADRMRSACFGGLVEHLIGIRGQVSWYACTSIIIMLVPEPKGRVATLGSMSFRRMSSLCQAAACERSQWPHLTVCAGCRWVKPGMSTSTSDSALATAALMRSAMALLIPWSALKSHSLVSVATCREFRTDHTVQSLLPRF